MAIAYASAGTRYAANASSHDVAYPATVGAGDLLVLHASVNGASVNNPPSGWTEIYNETTLSNPKGGVWIKVAAGTESGTVNFTTSSAASTGAQIFRYTGVDTTTPLDGTPTNVSNSTSSTTTVLPSITTTSTAAMLIYANSANSSSTTMSSATGTERVDHGDLGSAKAGALYDELLSASGATGTRTIDLSASRANWGAMLALREASSGAVDVAVPMAAVTLSGLAPDVAVGVNVDIPMATITLSAPAPNVSAGVSVDVPSAEITLATFAPDITVGVALDIPMAAISLSTTAPSVAAGMSVDIPMATITLTGHDPSFGSGTGVDIPMATVTVDAFSPTFSGGVNIGVPMAAITVTGHAPEFHTVDDIDIAVPVANVTVTGHDPSVSVGVNLAVAPWPIDVTGHAPQVSVGISLAAPPTVNITVQGFAPTFEVPINVNVPTAVITVATYNPIVSTHTILEGRDLSFDIKAVPVRPTTVVHRDRHKRLTLYVTAGEQELIGGVLTEITGQDISICSYKISLGTALAPGAWVDPDISEQGATPAIRTLKLLVSSDNATPGYYFIWIKVIDVIEIPLIRVPGIILVR